MAFLSCNKLKAICETKKKYCQIVKQRKATTFVEFNFYDVIKININFYSHLERN